MLLEILLLAVAIASIYVYLSERSRWRSNAWFVALSLRMLAIALLWLLLSPIELPIKRQRPYNPDIHLLVDASLSMRLSGADKEAIGVLSKLVHKLRELGEPPNIYIWAFGEKLREVNLDEAQLLKFTDERTRLVASMFALAEKIGNSHEFVAIVLTDGQDTDFDRLPKAIAKSQLLNGNWAIVGVGKRELPNTSVEVAPQFIFTFPKSIVTVRCTVKLVCGESYNGKLTVSLNGKRIHQSQLALTRENAKKTIELTISPSSGEHVIVASCTPNMHEQLVEDNKAMAFIKTVERNMRALFIAGSPNPEFKFIKRALESDETIDLLSLSERRGAGFLAQGNLVGGEQVLRLTIDRATLSKFDIVIVGNIGIDSLPPRAIDDLAWYVGERGGTLLILGGERSLLSSRNKTLVQLLPTEPPKSNFAVGEFIAADFSLIPTELGLKCPAVKMGFDGDAAKRLWEKLPKLKCGIILGRPKGGAQTLLKYDGVATSNDAALVWHRYGAGKVIVFAPFDTWRWWMDAAKRSKQPDEFMRFWQGMVKCMTVPLVDDFVTLTPSKTLVDTNEALTVHASHLGGLTSRPPHEISVAAMHESGAQITFKLGRHGSIFSGRIQLDKAGAWTLKPLRINGNCASVVAVAQLNERMRVGRNEAMLHAISKSFGCKIVSPDEAVRLVMERATKKPVRVEISTVRLVTLPWLYFAVLALLSLEWLLRRTRGLT